MRYPTLLKLFLAFLLIASIYIISDVLLTRRIDTTISRTCEEFNAKCPYILIPNTRLDAVVPVPSKSLYYSCTLLNYAIHGSQDDQFENSNPTESMDLLVNYILHDAKELDHLRGKNVVLKLIVLDRNGKYLSSYDIKL